MSNPIFEPADGTPADNVPNLVTWVERFNSSSDVRAAVSQVFNSPLTTSSGHTTNIGAALFVLHSYGGLRSMAGITLDSHGRAIAAAIDNLYDCISQALSAMNTAQHVNSTKLVAKFATSLQRAAALPAAVQEFNTTI